MIATLPTPYYERDGIVIYCADCRDILPHLVRVDRVITDPPYGVGFDSKMAKQRNGKVRTIQGGYGFDDTPEYVGEVVIPSIVRCIELAKSVVITPGTKSMWLYPVPSDVGCWYSAAGTGLSSWGFRCSQPILYYGSDPYLSTGKGARPNSVGQVWPNDANDSGHPCAKPIRFVKWLVTRSSLENETVLDPFMGSGTTLRAALDTGRKAIGIEISEKYCEIAVRRLQQSVMRFDIPA